MSARLGGFAVAAALAFVLGYVGWTGFASGSLSGLFPAVVGGIGLLAATVNLIQVARGTDAGAENLIPEGADARALAVLSIGVPLLYAVLLWLLGFWVASAAVILLLPRALGFRDWRVIFALGAATLIGVQVIFVTVFEMRLPEGLLTQHLLETLFPD